MLLLYTDDEERLQQAMLRLRGIGGAATLAVCSARHALPAKQNQATQDTAAPVKDVQRVKSGKASGQSKADGQGPRFRGADAVASWECLCQGGYAAPPGS
jgi:hypothetical protein